MMSKRPAPRRAFVTATYVTAMATFCGMTPAKDGAMKALKTLSRRHLHRVLGIKAGIDALEAELCKLLQIPPTVIAFRQRVRSKLIPAALRRQIAAAEQARLEDGGEDSSPLWKAHLRRRAAVRAHVKNAATAGWRKLRQRAKR